MDSNSTEREREDVLRRRKEGRSLGSLGNRERKLVVEGVVEARVNPRRRDIRRGDEKLFQTVPVCTSGRFLSSGWMKSRGKLCFKLAWSQKRKGEKKEGMGRGISNDCCSVACFRRLTVAPRFHLAGIEAIRSSPSKLWKKYLERGGKGMEFLPQFFSRNRANFCVEQIILSFWKT